MVLWPRGLDPLRPGYSPDPHEPLAALESGHGDRVDRHHVRWVPDASGAPFGRFDRGPSHRDRRSGRALRRLSGVSRLPRPGVRSVDGQPASLDASCIGSGADPSPRRRHPSHVLSGAGRWLGVGTGDGRQGGDRAGGVPRRRAPSRGRAHPTRGRAPAGLSGGLRRRPQRGVRAIERVGRRHPASTRRRGVLDARGAQRRPCVLRLPCDRDRCS